MKYQIQDWAGNIKFYGNQFDCFDDAREYLEENVDNSVFEKTGDEDDDELQEFNVVEI